MDAYIDGGRMTFGQNTRTVKEEDWRDRATNSDGTANRVRYVRYTPAVERQSPHLTRVTVMDLCRIIRR